MIYLNNMPLRKFCSSIPNLLKKITKILARKSSDNNIKIKYSTSHAVQITVDEIEFDILPSFIPEKEFKIEKEDASIWKFCSVVFAKQQVEFVKSAQPQIKVIVSSN